MLKREWGAESNGKLPHLFIPSKTANLAPEFAVEDLPLGRTAALMPEFAVKIPALGQNTVMMVIMMMISGNLQYHIIITACISILKHLIILLIYVQKNWKIPVPVLISGVILLAYVQGLRQFRLVFSCVKTARFHAFYFTLN